MPWLPGAVPLHYLDEGAGPAVVLFAGMASDGASWAPLVPAMSGGLRLIRPDNRGAGQTGGGPAVFADWVGDGLRLIRALGLEQVHLAGHSIGGAVAAHVAHALGPRVRSLSLLASAPGLPGRTRALFATLSALRAPGLPEDLWLRAFLPWLFRAETFEIERALDAAVDAALAYPHRQTAPGLAVQIRALETLPLSWPAPPRVPVQALLGAEDLLIPEPWARAALKALPPTSIRTIPGAGHALHWDAPAEVAAQLMAHLRAAEAGPGRASARQDDGG